MNIKEIKRNYQRFENKLFAQIKSYYPNSPKLLKIIFLIIWKVFQIKFYRRIPIQIPKKEIHFILKSLRKDGYIKLDKEKLYTKNELLTLHRIKELSLERITKFENNKHDPNFQKELAIKKSFNKKCLDKPFRYDLGNYMKFGKGPVLIKKDDIFNKLLIQIGLKSDFLQIAKKYLGIYPKLGRFYAWYDYPNNTQSVSTQLWHRDNDDIKFLKIFVALDKITKDNGAHSYIKKTHSDGAFHKIKGNSSTKFNTFKTFDQNQIWNLVPIHLKEVAESNFGTTIFEDTSGIHCGLKPKKGNRLMLTFEYFSRLSPHFVNYIIEDRQNLKDYQIEALL